MDALRRWARARGRDEDGTVLVLVPVGVLVIILLGAMAFDLSLAYQGERRVADLAAAWADDAAARIDEAAYYGASNEVRLDLESARQSVAANLDALDDPGLVVDDVVVDLVGLRTVSVTITARVPYLFLDAVPWLGAPVVASTSQVELVVP